MDTINEYEELIGPVKETLQLNRTTDLHLIDPPIPGTPFDVVGSFGYSTSSHNGYKESYFILTKGNELRTTIKSRENQTIIDICNLVEQSNIDIGLAIRDMRLPKSHGFSGNKKDVGSLRK